MPSPVSQGAAITRRHCFHCGPKDPIARALKPEEMALIAIDNPHITSFWMCRCGASITHHNNGDAHYLDPRGMTTIVQAPRAVVIGGSG